MRCTTTGIIIFTTNEKTPPHIVKIRRTETVPELTESYKNLISFEEMERIRKIFPRLHSIEWFEGPTFKLVPWSELGFFSRIIEVSIPRVFSRIRQACAQCGKTRWFQLWYFVNAKYICSPKCLSDYARHLHISGDKEIKADWVDVYIVESHSEVQEVNDNES